MKKLILVSLVSVLGMSVAKAAAEIKRVTYFPIPYVAYHNLHAEKMDIGLVSSENATVSLGTVNADVVPLTASSTMVNGTLTLNGDVITVDNEGHTAAVNIGLGTVGTATLNFTNLRLGSGTNFTNMYTEQMDVNTLTLFGKNFPSCKGAYSGASGEMKWVKLKLRGVDKCRWFLACLKENDNLLDQQCGGEQQPEEPEPTYSWVLEPGSDTTYACVYSSQHYNPVSDSLSLATDPETAPTSIICSPPGPENCPHMINSCEGNHGWMGDNTKGIIRKFNSADCNESTKDTRKKFQSTHLSNLGKLIGQYKCTKNKALSGDLELNL